MGKDISFSDHTHTQYAASNHKHSTSDITSGTLPVTRGGTGITSNPSCLINLASTVAASLFTSSPRPGVTGTLPLSNGGTGVTNLNALKDLLGIASISGLTCVDSETGYTNYDHTSYPLPSKFLDYMLVYYMVYFSKRDVSTQQSTPYLHHGIIMPNAIKTLKYYGEYDHDVYVYNDDFTIISFSTNGDFSSVYWKCSSGSTIYIFGYN